MMQFKGRSGWWRLLAWTAGAAALSSVALTSTATPSAIVIVVLFTLLMLLVQLSWQAASRRVEGEIRLAHQRLQTFIDTLPDAAWMKDLQGRHLAVNQNFAALVGRRPDEIIGLRDQDIFPIEIAHRLTATDQMALESGERLAYEEICPTDAQGQRWIETVKTPVRDVNGAVVGTVGITHDITSHRKAAEEREQTLALLRETLESTAEGFLLLDNEGHVVSFNRKLTEMSGLAADAFCDGNLDELLAWMLERVEDPNAVLARMEEIAFTPEAEFVDELRLSDGRIFERSTRPHLVRDRIAGRVWSFRDITSERTALEALNRRERQLAEAQRIARLGSFDWDIAADHVHASTELWRIAGFEPESFQWTLERFIECIHPEDQGRVRHEVEETLATGRPLSCEVRLIVPDGSIRFVAAVGHVIPDADGLPVRLVGTAQDVTDRWRAAAALERQVRIEQALTRISQLLAESPVVDTEAVLRILGEGLGAERTYLLQSRLNGEVLALDEAVEWCADGVAPALRGLARRPQPLPMSWMRVLDERDGLMIPSGEDLSRESLLDQGDVPDQVCSAAAVPVRDLRNGLSGLLGLDYGQSDRSATDEDLRTLRTAAEMLATHFARGRAEREIAQRDAILEAISFTAERLLRTSDWVANLDAAIGHIGAAARASRAYLFDNSIDEEGSVRVSMRSEWTAEGITPEIDNPAMQKVRLGDLGLGRWEEALRRNEPVQELVQNMSEPGREHLASQSIRSVLLIPIIVGEAWWGFLGFDDCVSDREWSHTEREVLMAAGRMIGGAIQRKQAEEALRESEMRFTQLSDNIPEVFYMTPVDMSQVLYLSPSFERVWGRSLAEAYADPRLFMDSIVPEDLPILHADMELSQRGDGDPMRHVDYRILRPDGSIRWIRNRVFQIPDENGNPYRVAGVCTDITDQKQLEEDLRRASRIEAIGHLAAGIAHEINTPIQYVGDNLRFLDESYSGMQSVLAAYEALLEEARTGAVSPERIAAVALAAERADIDYLFQEAPRASAQALDGVQRVAEIVRAMKEFSHPGNGIKVPTDLNQAIRSTTTVARNEWKYIAELVTELDENLPAVHCLPGELNQALLNLVINAAHAIADRQQAEGSDAPGTIAISTAVVRGGVEVRVRDTGTGIPAEIHPRIFDPFFTTKEVGRGTGQGLTFVHSIVVEKHQGTVTFETVMGVGTTFIIRLPIAAGAPELGAAA